MPPPAPVPVQANAAADAARTVAPEAASITNSKRSVGMTAGSYGGGIVRNKGGARGVATAGTATAQRSLTGNSMVDMWANKASSRTGAPPQAMATFIGVKRLTGQ